MHSRCHIQAIGVERGGPQVFQPSLQEQPWRHHCNAGVAAVEKRLAVAGDNEASDIWGHQSHRSGWTGSQRRPCVRERAGGLGACVFSTRCLRTCTRCSSRSTLCAACSIAHQGRASWASNASRRGHPSSIHGKILLEAFLQIRNPKALDYIMYGYVGRVVYRYPGNYGGIGGINRKSI